MTQKISSTLTPTRRFWQRLTGGLAALFLVGAAAYGCGVTEQEVKLAQQTFKYDLVLAVPPQITSIPTIPCTDSNVCVSALKLVGLNDPRIRPSCDTAAMVCVADANITILYKVNVANDPAFTTGIAQGQADNMRDVKMTYGVTSTVNVDIEKIDVYVGPGDTLSVSGPGVNYLGKVGPILKNSVLPDGENYLLIADGSLPHEQFVDAPA